MGMAASQARYLALSARKTNTEYEGQQINQARTALANESADLFNQMLGIQVPTCPDSTNYTKLQYSWSDGINTSVLDEFYQLGTADEEYNYVVKSYHYENVYTGSRKLLHDPQIQSSMKLEYNYDADNKDLNKTYNIKMYNYDFMHDKYIFTLDNDAIKTLTRVEDDWGDTRLELDAIYGRTETYSANGFFYDDANDTYVLDTDKTDDDGNPIIYTFNKVDMNDEEAVQKLKDTFGLEYDENENYYYDDNSKMYVKESDIKNNKNNIGIASDIKIRKQDDGSIYYTDGEYYMTAQEIANITPDNNQITMKKGEEDRRFFDFTAVGNCKLTELTEKDWEDKDVKTELAQIIKDMRGENGNAVSAANFEKCFDETGQYLGGIYSFKMNGVVYYTTLDDLEESAKSAFYENSPADNSIDMQTTKLPYYKATYLKTKIEETLKALLETDGSGRFSSVKFEDDSVVYTLNTEAITDEDAYQNAMNQYYYKQQVYDKAIADINAKTELIQAQDRTLELRLKQLDTEQNALQTEMEAVKKVISKNVESTFKTFSGG